jgi:hypothetical protein
MMHITCIKIIVRFLFLPEASLVGVTMVDKYKILGTRDRRHEENFVYMTRKY